MSDSLKPKNEVIKDAGFTQKQADRFHENDTAVVFVKPKTQVIKDAGFTQKQAERFQKRQRCRF